MQTTVRIARKIRTEQGSIIRTEVYGEWFVRPDEWPNSHKADYIKSSLVDVQSAEPTLGWILEFRGTDVTWHV